MAMAVASEAEGQKLAALLPGSRLVIIAHPDGGLHSDEPGPKPALQAIDDFLATLPPEAASPEPAPITPRPQFQVLSPREVEILRLVAVGKSSREIGEALVLSVRTVERHIANIYLKTETHGRAQIAMYARDNGLY
jgi:DNA-binding NarL/FixJ family response regulator